MSFNGLLKIELQRKTELSCSQRIYRIKSEWITIWPCRSICLFMAKSIAIEEGIENLKLEHLIYCFKFSYDILE